MMRKRDKRKEQGGKRKEKERENKQRKGEGNTIIHLWPVLLNFVQ